MADDVRVTVKTVSDIDHKSGSDGGAVNAYHELKKEYDEYANAKDANGNLLHSAQDTKNYWNEVAKDLVDAKVLPDLAIAWGKENDANGKTADDLTHDFKFADKYNLISSSPQFDFDKTFATQLASEVGDLTKLQDGIHPFGLFSDTDHIHTQELDQYLENQQTHNQELQQEQDKRNEQSPLFTGNPPLIQVLDGANDNDRLDGHISRADMERYLADYNRFTNHGQNPAPPGSPYSQENAQFVQDILDGKHDNLDNSGDARNGFNLCDLAKAGGYTTGDVSKPEDYKGVTDSFNAAQQTIDSPPTTTDTPTTTNDPPKPGADGAIHRDSQGHIDQITTDSSHLRTFRYGPDDRGENQGQLVSITNPDGQTYTKQADGSWVNQNGQPAPFKNVSIDQKTGAVRFERNDNSGISDQYAPDGTVSTVTHDRNGADITKNSQGLVTDISYQNGKSRHFEYKDGKLVSFTDEDGQTFATTDGTTFTSGNGTRLTNVSVDSDGTVHATNDEKGWPYKIGTDDVVSRDDSRSTTVDKLTPEQLKSIDDKIVAQMIEDSRARPGEGYIKIAARLLGKPDANDTDPAVAALYKELMSLNGNKPLHPGDAILTPEILAQVQNGSLKAYIATLEDKAAAQVLANPASANDNSAHPAAPQPAPEPAQIVNAIGPVDRSGFPPIDNPTATNLKNAGLDGQCTYWAALHHATPWARGGSVGNAIDWFALAKHAGVETADAHHPVPGAIACFGGGTYGHVAIVKSVNADGSFVVSEMNVINTNYGEGSGIVDERTIRPGDPKLQGFIVGDTANATANA